MFGSSKELLEKKELDVEGLRKKTRLLERSHAEKVPNREGQNRSNFGSWVFPKGKVKFART